jgi:hypothetical protein
MVGIFSFTDIIMKELNPHVNSIILLVTFLIALFILNIIILNILKFSFFSKDNTQFLKQLKLCLM